MLSNCGAGKDSWESLGQKGIKPVNPKGNQPLIFIWRTDAEAPILWPPEVKSQVIGKDLDAGKEWGQEAKGVTEDEMVGSPTQRIWVWANSRRWLKDREAWRAAVHEVARSRTRLSKWTATTKHQQPMAIVTHQQAKWHTHQHHDNSEAHLQISKSGQGPNSSHSLAYEISQPIEMSHVILQGHSCLLRWHTLMFAVFL